MASSPVRTSFISGLLTGFTWSIYPMWIAKDSIGNLPKCYLERVRLGSIRNKNNWNNASKRLFGSYSHSGIPGFPFRLFYSQEQNSRNIFRNKFLFRNIPNERALNCKMNYTIISRGSVNNYCCFKKLWNLLQVSTSVDELKAPPNQCFRHKILHKILL